LWTYRWNSHSFGGPSKQEITLVIGDLFNMKEFHSIVLQVVCDLNKIFWNICVGQPRGVHDGG